MADPSVGTAPRQKSPHRRRREAASRSSVAIELSGGGHRAMLFRTRRAVAAA